MKKIKINKLTKEMLLNKKVFPIETETYYRDFLDDNMPEIKIGNLKYSAGRVLEKVDPIAFDQSMFDHFDSLKIDKQVLEIDGDYFWIHEIEKHFELKG